MLACTWSNPLPLCHHATPRHNTPSSPLCFPPHSLWPQVWLAKYCGALVAVKILARIGSDNLTSSLQNDLLMRSLKKEALLMSKLRHPNGECQAGLVQPQTACIAPCAWDPCCNAVF